MLTETIEKLVQALGEKARATGAVIATAESCTAGGISYAITAMAGSSAWFDRGFVTYTNEAKMALLGVSEESLKAHGAVSAEVASEMVLGALEKSNATIATAVTGIAGPGGAVPGKSVGTVYLAWCRKGQTPIVVRETFSGSRQAVREATIARALAGLIENI